MGKGDVKNPEKNDRVKNKAKYKNQNPEDNRD